jgi:hypothetical protein
MWTEVGGSTRRIKKTSIMRSFTKYEGDQVKEDEILVKKPEWRDHAEDLGVDGWITVQWILGNGFI